MERSANLGARLLAWAAALKLYERLDDSAKARLGAHWKQRQLPELLATLLTVLPLEQPTAARLPPLKHTSVAAVCEAACGGGGGANDETPSDETLAVALYCQLLQQLPALVRHWWSHSISGRGASAALARFTESQMSPLLLRQEIEALGHDAEVTASGPRTGRGACGGVPGTPRAV